MDKKIDKITYEDLTTFGFEVSLKPVYEILVEAHNSYQIWWMLVNT